MKGGEPARLALRPGAWLLLACLAASAAGAARQPLPVRLLLPESGAELVAGEEATLSWTAPSVFPAGIEEWEAFLSLDGGGTYPIRVTSHLDTSLRQIAWTVPGVPTAHARLLLRFGDEREERELDPGVEFSIRKSITPDLLRDLADRTALAPGEAARPGLRGVTAWVEGDRRGTWVRSVRVGSVWPVVAPATRVALPTCLRFPSEEPDDEMPDGALAPTAADPASPPARAARSFLSPAPRAAPDLLSRHQRWNV